MVEEAVELSLARLGRSFAAKYKSAKISLMFEEALGYLENLEHVCVDALELMLRRHLAGQLQKPYAILNVNYQMMLPPLPVEEGHAS